MQVNPYLHFNGQCEEAFQLYAQLLGGKIEMIMPHAGTPAEGHVPPEWRAKIMHAHLNVGGQAILGTDVPPGMYSEPKGYSVSIQVKDPAEAKRIFTGLAEGGTVKMPIEQTFWSPAFGMVVDRFGIPWMVNTEAAAA
jgi:PhnB protein